MAYSKDNIIQHLKAIKPELEKKYSIRELGLFGSYARGDQSETSDIDILVDVDGSIGLGYFRLVNDLEDEFRVKVDVVSRKGIKPRYLPFIEKNLIRV